MDDHDRRSAHGQWVDSLRSLTADADGLRRWQDERYRFAHRVGRLLAGPHENAPALRGPALYGVFIPGAGLCYVGQTEKAERRLRDLPVGESHHLATTLPAELWERVVVVSWPTLKEHAPAGEQEAMAELGDQITGLALEHSLQVATAPPVNSRKRQADGTWRPRNLEQSGSRGALNAQRLPKLTGLVSEVWTCLSAVAAPEGASVLIFPHGRVVFPSSLHGDDQPG